MVSIFQITVAVPPHSGITVSGITVSDYGITVGITVSGITVPVY